MTDKTSENPNIMVIECPCGEKLTLDSEVMLFPIRTSPLHCRIRVYGSLRFPRCFVFRQARNRLEKIDKSRLCRSSTIGRKVSGCRMKDRLRTKN